MKRRENGPRTASKRRGLYFPALPVTGVLWRVVAVLTALAALVCLAACSVWARGCWENHAALAGVQETQYAAPLVRDYRLTNGGFSYEVDTAMGETKTVMTIYPGIRSDGGRYGKGFYVEKNGGWVKPVTVGDAWRSCGSALVLGVIARWCSVRVFLRRNANFSLKTTACLTNGGYEGCGGCLPSPCSWQSWWWPPHWLPKGLACNVQRL